MGDKELKKDIVSTTIYLRKNQMDWIRDNESFNLSGFVREKIDELMKKEGH